MMRRPPYPRNASSLTGVLLLAALASSACGSEEPAARPDASARDAEPAGDATVPDAGDAPDAGPDAGTEVTRTVRFTETLHRVSEDGVTQSLGSYTGESVRIYVDDPRGGYRFFDGTQVAENVLEVAGVPEGEVTALLSYRSGAKLVLVTSSSSIDLGFALGGREDLNFAQASTPVSVTIDGLTPWRSTDELALFSLEADALVYGLQNLVDQGVPQPGDTSATMSFDYFYSFQPLIEAGDQALLYQLSTTTAASGLIYLSAQRALALPDDFEVLDGRPAAIAGQLVAPAETAAATLDWDVPGYWAAVRAVHPSAEPLEAFAALSALPHVEAYGQYGGAPDLLLSYGTDADPRRTSELRYRRTVPAGWQEFWTFGQNYLREYRATPAAQPAPYAGYIGSVVAASALVVGEPALLPARNLRVNGLDAMEDQSGTGEAALFEWDPPARGQAKTYQLTFLQITADGGSTVLETLGWVHTDRTSVRLPPGFLPHGKYFVRLLARDCDCSVARPYLSGLPVHEAEVLSGVLER